jgi:hypothetical protein
MINYFDEIAADAASAESGEASEGFTETPVTEQVEPVETTEPAAQPETPSEFEIDGEKYTIDQIKEWKQGNLRQSDYTKKTQALAKEREQNKQALEVFNYLQSNPELLKTLAEYEPKAAESFNPQNSEVQDLRQQIQLIQINNELDKIRSTDPDIDDVELINIATERVCPISEAYNYYKGLHMDKYLKKHAASLTQQIKNNTQGTTTFISPKVQAPVANHGLSKQEMEMADKLDMSYEDYAKWK